MSYPEFLVQWYNLVFLAFAAAGLAAWAWGRATARDLSFVPACLAGVAVVGLTLTGAVHDLQLGSPRDYFPLLFPLALLLGAGAGWGVHRLRMRWFPPVNGLRWNPEGEEGQVARIISPEVTGEPGSGRAQWQNESGVLTVVRCHTRGPELRFGKDVELHEYDGTHESYRVVAC